MMVKITLDNCIVGCPKTLKRTRMITDDHQRISQMWQMGVGKGKSVGAHIFNVKDCANTEIQKIQLGDCHIVSSDFLLLQHWLISNRRERSWRIADPSVFAGKEGFNQIWSQKEIKRLRLKESVRPILCQNACVLFQGSYSFQKHNFSWISTW